MTSGSRARSMAPAERRAAIIQATIPLLRTRGWGVTTKEIAAVAGVAEGTIFSVFGDKDTLLTVALSTALEIGPTVARLLQIDSSLPLDDRLCSAVEILREMMAEIWPLLATLQYEEVQRRLGRYDAADFLVQVVLAPLFGPPEQASHIDSTVAAKALVALTIAGTNPSLFSTPLSAREIASLVTASIS